MTDARERIRVYNSVMKARIGFALLALVGRLGAAEPVHEMSFTWVDDSNPTVSAIKSSALRAIDLLGGNLIGETERLISTVGLAESAEVLHLQNLRLPRAVPGRPRMTGFKFTSYRIRNPRNAPDAAERAALDLIRAQLNSGEASSSPLIQRVDRPGAPTEWRFYRPIATMPTCLYCHGDPDSLQPSVRNVLNRRFPEDQAVGYSEYGWRGIVRVSFELPEPADATTSG